MANANPLPGENPIKESAEGQLKDIIEQLIKRHVYIEITDLDAGNKVLDFLLNQGFDLLDNFYTRRRGFLGMTIYFVPGVKGPMIDCANVGIMRDNNGWTRYATDKEFLQKIEDAQAIPLQNTIIQPTNGPGIYRGNNVSDLVAQLSYLNQQNIPISIMVDILDFLGKGHTVFLPIEAICKEITKPNGEVVNYHIKCTINLESLP